MEPKWVHLRGKTVLESNHLHQLELVYYIVKTYKNPTWKECFFDSRHAFKLAHPFRSINEHNMASTQNFVMNIGDDITPLFGYIATKDDQWHETRMLISPKGMMD
jgi:hypothetical protein